MVVFWDIKLLTEIESATSVFSTVICKNDLTIARRPNDVVECHLVAGWIFEFVVQTRILGAWRVYISSLRGIKNGFIVQIGTGEIRVVVSLRLLNNILTLIIFLVNSYLLETKKWLR